MADLHQPALLVRTGVDGRGGDELQVGQHALEGLLGTGGHDGTAALGDHVRVAADRGGQELHTPLRGGLPYLRRRLGGHGGAVDDDGRQPLAVEQPALAESHVEEVGRCRHHDEHDVRVSQIALHVDGLGPLGDQGLGLGPGTVPDGHVGAPGEEAFDHHGAHAPGAEPAEPVREIAVHRSFLTFGHLRCVESARVIGTVLWRPCRRSGPPRGSRDPPENRRRAAECAGW